MGSELKRLQDELDITTIYVTHNQEEAMGMGDRIVVMNRGTIRQVATPEELYSRPRTAWVAQFIGSPPMNMIRGTRRNGTIDLGDAGSVDLEVGASSESVSLGIRPEDLAVASERPSNGYAIEGTVDTVEPLGEYTIVNVTVDGQVVKVKEGVTNVARGDQVFITFDDRDAYLYDEDGNLVP
jgi:multiple sugar transport system ATP-binding protein